MSALLDDAPGPAGGLVALDGSSKRSARPCTCQVPGCMNPVLNGRAYYRRYRICVQHTRETEIVIDGVRSRWCQQCARFQPIGDFDANHRTCRVRLARHNATRHARGERGERARQQAQLAAQQQQRQQQHHHKRQQQKQQQRGQQHSPADQGDVHGSSFAACPLPPSPFEFPGTMHAAPAPAQPNLGPSLHLPSAQLQQVGVLPDGTPAYIQVKGDPATLAGGMHGATQAGPLMFTEPLLQAAGPAGGQGAGPRRASSSSAPATTLEYHPASHSLQASMPTFAHGVVAQQLVDGTVVLLQQHPLQVRQQPQAQARPARLLSVPPEEHLSGELAEAVHGAERQIHMEAHSPKAAAAGQAAGAAGGAPRVSAGAEPHAQPPPRKAVSANASRLQLLAQQLCEHDDEQPGSAPPAAPVGQEPGPKVPVVLPDGTTVMASLLPSAGRAGVTSVGTHHQGADTQLGASEPMQLVTYKELQRQAVAVPAPDCQASFAFSADSAARMGSGSRLGGSDEGGSMAFTFQPTTVWAGSGGPVQVQLGGGMLLDVPQSSGKGASHRLGAQPGGSSGTSEEGARMQQVVGVKRSHAAAMEQRDGSEASQAAVSAAKVALQHSGSPNGTANADHSDATQLPLRDAVGGVTDASVVYTTAGDGPMYQLVHPAESPLLPAGGVVYCMAQGGGTYCMELPPQHQGLGMVSVMSEDAQHGQGGEPLGYADMGLGKGGPGGGVVYAPMCVQVMGAGGEVREGAPTMWLHPAGGSQLLAGTQLISPDSMQLLAGAGQPLGDPLQQVLTSAQVVQAPGEGESLVAGPGGQLRLLSSQLVTPTSSGMQGANLISPLGSQLLFATNSGPQLLSGLLQTNSTAAVQEEAGVAWA